MVAYPPADAGKGVVLFKQFYGFSIFPVVDERDIALNADMSRAGGLAGRCASFADGKGAGYGLGIFFINGFAGGKAFVLFI